MSSHNEFLQIMTFWGYIFVKYIPLIFIFMKGKLENSYARMITKYYEIYVVEFKYLLLILKLD